MFDLIDCCQQKIVSGYFIKCTPGGQFRADTDASLCVRLFYVDNSMEQAPVGRMASSLAQPAISVICTIK
jgi:hypothetical protein